MKEFVSTIQDRLQARAEAKTRRWWTQYLKGEAVFRGVKMADVREVVHTFWEDYDLELLLTPADQRKLALRLFQEQPTEDKLAGTLIIQEILVPRNRAPWPALRDPVVQLFDDGHLADWNAVDWFCVKALAAVLDASGQEAAHEVLAWSRAENLWRARASVVAFVGVVGKPDSYPPDFEALYLESCGRIIARPERFAKTGVGWTMRDFAEVRPDLAESFIRDHLEHFSREALENAIKKLRPARQKAIREAFRG